MFPFACALALGLSCDLLPLSSARLQLRSVPFSPFSPSCLLPFSTCPLLPDSPCPHAKPGRNYPPIICSAQLPSVVCFAILSSAVDES